MGDSKKAGDIEEVADHENVRKAESPEALSSLTIGPGTALASLGHLTQADLEQVQEGFAIKCSLDDVKVLLHSYAQKFQSYMDDGAPCVPIPGGVVKTIGSTPTLDSLRWNILFNAVTWHCTQV